MGTGYLSATYARSFSRRGEIRSLPSAGTWLLLRRVSAAEEAVDASGLYPLLACADWEALPADLAELDEHVVSVVAVADPLGPHTPGLLEAAFPALVRPFKRHLVIDTSRPFATGLPSNHRRNIARAARALDVEVDVDAADVERAWVRLYGELVERHGIVGPAAFTAEELVDQLRVPGARIVRALRDGETVAVQVWLPHADAYYYHLGASSALGYEHAAGFALFDRAIRQLATAAAWLVLGAGAGLEEDRGSGLVRFKQPWANTSATAFLCGRISAPDRYAALCGPRSTSFFPAYRRPATMTG